MRTGSIVRPPRRRARRYPRALEFLPHFRMPVRADSPYGMAPKDLAFAASVLTRHPVTAARKAPRLCPGHRLSNGWRCRPDTFSEPYRSFETNRVFPNRIRGVNRLTAAIATTCAGSQRLPVFTFGTNDGAPLQNSKTLAWPGAMGEAPAYFAVTGTPNGGRNDLSLKNDFTVILDRVETNAAPAQPVQPESKPSK